MSGNPSDAFHFVNEDPAEQRGSSASRSRARNARSFVMRRARRREPWSTRSVRDEDRRRTRQRRPSQVGQAGPSSSLALADAQSAMSATATAPQDHVVLDQGSHPYVIWNGLALCLLCGLPRWSGSDARTCHCEARQTQPSFGPLGGDLDPFDSLPVPMNQDNSELVSFFVATITPRLTPISGQTSPELIHQHWISPALRHRAFAHALLCLISLRRSLTDSTNTRHVARCLFHRVQSIVAIQENLNNPAEATSNENIAAVFNLACVEGNLLMPAFQVDNYAPLRFDNAQIQVHLNGLRRMIGLRGGIANLGGIHGLQSFMIRQAAILATVSFIPSQCLPLGLLGELYSYPETSRFFASQSPIIETLQRLELSPELVSLVHSAACLVRDTEAWPQYGLDAMDLQNMYSISLHDLMRWYVDHVEHAAGQPVTANGIICLSLFMLLAFICRGRQAVHGPLPSTIDRLKRHCAADDVLEPLEGTGLDVWIAVLAVMGSRGYRDEDFFMQQFASVIESQTEPIESFEVLRQRLGAILWFDTLDQYAASIWDYFATAGEDNEQPLPPVELPNQTLLNPYTHGHPAGQVEQFGDVFD